MISLLTASEIWVKLTPDVSGKKGAEIGCVGVVQDERVGGSFRQGCMAGQPDGLFWAADVPPIRHNLHGFHVEDTYNSLVKFRQPFPVNEGELHFYGIYRYEVVSNPIIGKGTFALVPTCRPTHAEVLRKLLARDEISDRWKQQLRPKLKELGDKS
jgi:hypothetical protein